MPRGAVSGADLALIAECAAREVSVSPYQLERWRAAGVLPKPVRHGLGRGRGSTSAYSPEALGIALALGRAAGQGRCLHDTVLSAFYGEARVPIPALKEALLWLQRRGRARYTRVREGGESAEAAEIARTQRLMEAWRRVTNPDVGVRSLPSERRVARRRQRAALRLTAANVVRLGLYDDVEEMGPEGLAEAAVAIGMGHVADEMLAAMIKAQVRGEEIWPQRRHSRVERAFLRNPTLERMPAARSALALWGVANVLLDVAVKLQAAEAGPAVEVLADHEELAWYRSVGPPFPAFHLAMAPAILTLAANPDQIEEAWCWAAWTVSVAYRSLCGIAADAAGPERAAAVWRLAGEVTPEGLGTEAPDQLCLPGHVWDAVTRALELTSHPQLLRSIDAEAL